MQGTARTIDPLCSFVRRHAEAVIVHVPFAKPGRLTPDGTHTQRNPSSLERNSQLRLLHVRMSVRVTVRVLHVRIEHNLDC
jgi:hypothetical protein